MSTQYELRAAVDQADADMAAIDAGLATLDAQAFAAAADAEHRAADATQAATVELASLDAKHAALHSKALASFVAHRNGPRIELRHGDHITRTMDEARQRSAADDAERKACLDRLQAALAAVVADEKVQRQQCERRRAELTTRRTAVGAHRGERQEQYRRASSAYLGGHW